MAHGNELPSAEVPPEKADGQEKRVRALESTNNAFTSASMISEVNSDLGLEASATKQGLGNSSHESVSGTALGTPVDRALSRTQANGFVSPRDELLSGTSHNSDESKITDVKTSSPTPSSNVSNIPHPAEASSPPSTPPLERQSAPTGLASSYQSNPASALNSPPRPESTTRAEVSSPASSPAPQPPGSRGSQAESGLANQSPVQAAIQPSPQLDRPVSIPAASASASDNAPQSSFNRNIANPPNPSPASRSSQELSSGDRAVRGQTEPASAAPRPSWYARTAEAREGISDSVQRPGGASTALTERPPVDRGALAPMSSAAGKSIDSAADRLADKNPISGGRVNSDIVKDGLISDGKGGTSKATSWLDGPEAATRKPENSNFPGQISYGGATPDGREHPFGLAGRVMDPKVDAGKNVPGGSGSGIGDASGGRGQGGKTDTGPSVIGQIFDGHGGWKPNIQLPSGDKAGKGGDSAGRDDDKGPKGDKGGGRKSAEGSILDSTIIEERSPRAKPGDRGLAGRRALDGSLLDSTMIEEREPKAGGGDTRLPVRRAVDGSPLEATMHEEGGPGQRSGLKGGRLEPPVRAGEGGKSPGEAFIGIIESVKNGIFSGARAQFDSGRGAKDSKVPSSGEKSSSLTAGSSEGRPLAGAKQSIPGELTVTGVRTKAWPVDGNGSPVSPVVALTPFLSGLDSSLRVARGFGVNIADTGSGAAFAPASGIAQGTPFGRAAESSNTSNTSNTFNTFNTFNTSTKHIGGDTVEVPHLMLNENGELPAFVQEGRLKARPSVSMHVSGGKYGGKAGEQPAPKLNPLADKPRPYISVSNEGALYDLSQTSTEIPFPEAPLTEREVPDPPAEAAGESQKPAKAIDELESTAQMSPAELREIRQGNRDDRYLYVVQEGDTVESVASTVLHAPGLAPLLFSLNRRYVLPEVLYGVHPLMVGVVIKLPTPADILKFGQS